MVRYNLTGRGRIRQSVGLRMVIAILLSALTGAPAAASLGSVYDQIAAQDTYADSIERVRNYGDGVSDEQIKAFLADLEARLRARNAGADNFNKAFVYALIDVVILPQYRAKHSAVIGAVASIWDLNPRSLYSAMRRDGVDGALALVPGILIEASRIIKQSILQTAAQPEPAPPPDTPSDTPAAPPGETAAGSATAAAGGEEPPAAGETAREPAGETAREPAGETARETAGEPAAGESPAPEQPDRGIEPLVAAIGAGLIGAAGAAVRRRRR